MEDETIQSTTSNKLKPLEHWSQFESDTEAIQILFNKLIDKFDIPHDSFSAKWCKGQFAIWIDIDSLRSQLINAS